MDSRSLHLAVSHALLKVVWEQRDASEYVLVGNGERINPERLRAILQSAFQNEAIWLSAGRHRGGRIEEKDLAGQLDEQFALGTQVVRITNEDFSKFVEVQSIGVARSGHRKLTKPSTGRGVSSGPA